MPEKIIQKIMEYKIFIGLSLIGFIIGGSIILKNTNTLSQNKTEVVNQEITSNSSSSHMEISDSKTQEEKEEDITIDVKGAVKQPGIYQMKAGSRVYEALQKAGGLTENADHKSINQAQKLKDESVIYVATIGEEATDVNKETEEKEQKSSLVNLNTATETELQTISGIGLKRAQDIINYRETNGNFRSIEDLKNVSGFGAKTIEKIKDYVTVD